MKKVVSSLVLSVVVASLIYLLSTTFYHMIYDKIDNAYMEVTILDNGDVRVREVVSYLNNKNNVISIPTNNNKKEFIESDINSYKDSSIYNYDYVEIISLNEIDKYSTNFNELNKNKLNYEVKDNTYTWTPSTIRNVLKNEVYIGNTVQGKRRAKSYKIHKIENVPEEEWVRVENTHEPIIDRETFEKAQELSRKDVKVSQKTNELSIWAGFLKCADCRRAMNKKSSTNKGGNKYEYYICSTYKKKSNKLCTKHTIKEEWLEKAVMQVINLHIELLIDTEEIVQQINENSFQNTKNENIANVIVTKQNKIHQISNFKRTLYEDWKNEDITREEYIEYKQKYENDIERLNQNIERLEIEKKKYESQNKDQNEWIEKFREQKGITELSRDIIIELIDCIYVKENGNIVIKFKFEDEFKRILEYI